MKNKNDWRQSLLQYRSCNNKNSLNTCIQLRLWRVVQSFSAVLPILAYYPILGEVNLIPVYQALLKAQYPLYFPVTYSDGYMEFFYVRTYQNYKNKKIHLCTNLYIPIYLIASIPSYKQSVSSLL